MQCSNTSPIVETPQPLYDLKIENNLMAMLIATGLSYDDVYLFFATQIDAMMKAKPNVKIYAKPIWVMRGYYPSSPIFFKLSLIKNVDKELTYTGSQYYAKAAIPAYSKGKRKNYCMLSSNDIQPVVSRLLENAILDAGHHVEPLPRQHYEVKKMRCMSPQGVKVYNLKRTRKKCIKS